ncbi:MAG: hypothetical protein WKF97_14065 [Chitinophagaceae bacterium]
MKLKLLILSFLFIHSASAQDISGIWRGSFYSSDKFLSKLNTEDRYKLEVQVDQRNQKIDGVSYSYKSTVFYGKAVANGTVNVKTGKVRLEELKIVEIRMQQNSYACVMTYFLQYTKNGNEEILEGDYSSYGEKDSIPCGKGKVYLRKVTTSDFYREPFLVRRENEKNSKKVSPPVARKTSVSAPIAKNTTSSPKSKPAMPGKPVDKTVTAKKPTGPPIARTTPKLPANKTGTSQNNNIPSITKSSPKTTAKPPAKTLVTRGDPAGSKPLNNKPIGDIGKADSIKKDDRSFRKTISVNIPKPLATRENELVKTIIVNSNEVSVNLYDNGTIDGDTVSVYLDKTLIVSRQLLTTKPISLKLTLDEITPYHELVMVAENLGTIPPNTSLMVVKAGDKQYEVRITSTEQKNAVIIFKYEKQ